MPWPDIFFKSRKSKSPASVLAPSAPKTAADMEKEALKKTEQTREAGRLAEEKADSLRALTESGRNLNPAREGPDATRTEGASEKDSPAITSSDAKTARLDSPPLVADLTAGGGVRSQAVSLRQRAKLTDDARIPLSKEPAPIEVKNTPAGPEKKNDEPASSPPKTSPAAVVPPAFPVAAEVGSLLEKTPEKSAAELAPSPESSPEKASTAFGNASVAHPSEPTIAPPAPMPRETTHVHLGSTMKGGASAPAPTDPVKTLSTDLRGRKEFVLANGERILGHILSETAQTIYLDHGTLGVLTLPRSQIAKHPIEVILINGDRIVGDLIAETPECLYVKHASLGMLTVPHNQRSTRVVEAIMKDGDRILGEVLAETAQFTVIRSATLGTVAVQHDQVAMFNRKIEQMQLRALPTTAAALDDKAPDAGNK